MIDLGGGCMHLFIARDLRLQIVSPFWMNRCLTSKLVPGTKLVVTIAPALTTGLFCHPFNCGQGIEQ
jgi:hypothetical protein